MRRRRNQHQWEYMGVSKGNERGEFKGELGYCSLCKNYRVNALNGFTIIKKKRFMKLKIERSENW